MKKCLLYAVLFVLAFAFAGCSPNTPSNTVSSQDEQTSSTYNSTESKTVEKAYYGQWQIEKELSYAPASTYSYDDIRAIIGKRFMFSKDGATCFGDKVEYLSNTAINPFYKETVISKRDFEESNKVTFDKLGIKGDSIIQVDVFDANDNGCTFFIKDDDTLILSGGGAYFELSRIDTFSFNSALEAFKAVFLNNIEFYSTDNKKKIYLNDFITNNEIYDTTFQVTKFTVLDMNGDKAPEVVLELSSGDLPSFYEVLHYMNDTVYGYIFTYRSLGELKADGTFMYSSGAADSGVGKLKFESDTYNIDILGCIKPSEGDTSLTISYFIDNKPVTEEDYDTFINEQYEKKDAVWYEYSQKNIETEFKEAIIQ